MKTVDVTYKRHESNGFEVTHPADTNDHGYFVLPQAYCPECFCLMSGDACDMKDIEEGAG